MELLFYHCLFLNLCFYFVFLCLLMKYFKMLWNSLKQTKILIKIQTCPWNLKISTADQKSQTFVKCLSLPKRNLGRLERKP
jgi:hypothetical protein